MESLDDLRAKLRRYLYIYEKMKADPNTKPLELRYFGGKIIYLMKQIKEREK